jgi:hypothetical protein
MGAMERMARMWSGEPEFSHGRELCVFTSDALVGMVSFSPYDYDL